MASRMVPSSKSSSMKQAAGVEVGPPGVKVEVEVKIEVLVGVLVMVKV